jgi:hypothetical protein
VHARSGFETTSFTVDELLVITAAPSSPPPSSPLLVSASPRLASRAAIASRGQLYNAQLIARWFRKESSHHHNPRPFFRHTSTTSGKAQWSPKFCSGAASVRAPTLCRVGEAPHVTDNIKQASRSGYGNLVSKCVPYSAALTCGRTRSMLQWAAVSVIG